MFELQIVTADKEIKASTDALVLLKRIVDGLSEMVEDAEIKVNDQGLSLQIMDSMHTALADIHLGKQLFSQFRCDRSLVLGIKLKGLAKILRYIKTEDGGVFTMYCQDIAKELTISYKSDNYSMSFNQKLYSLDQKTYSFPAMKYTVDVRVKTEDFLLVPKIIGSFGEFITIAANKESIMFIQNGDLTDSSLVLENKEDRTSINVIEPVTKDIAVKYINYMSKAGMMVASVRMCMGEESPVYFEFNLDDLGYMRYYIAPRLRENEE